MIRKSFAFLFALIFIVVAVPAMILFGLNRTLLNQDFYKGPLIADVYERLMPMLANEAYSRAQNQFAKYLTEGEFAFELKRSIPLSEFRKILDDSFAQFNEILAGSGKTKIIIKLDGLKSSLKSLGENIFETVKQKAPPCKKGQIPRFDPMPSCTLPEFNTDAYKKDFSRQIDLYINQFFSQVKPVELDAGAIVQNLKEIKIAQLVIQCVFALFALFGLFIVLVLWKPFTRGMRWLGGAMVFVAFEALVVYKIVSISTANLNLGLENIPPKYADSLHGVAQFAIASFNKQILYFMIAFVAAGAVLSFLGYLLKNKNLCK